MNRVRLFFYLISLTLLGYLAFQFFAKHTIKKIGSFTQAADILNSADKNTLVLFDVDNTLITPASKVFWPRLQQEHAEWMNTTLKQVFDRAQKSPDFYIDIWLSTELPMVIEPSIIETIQHLQQRGIPVLALTTMDTGSTEHIPALPEWRLQTLRAVGVDFSHTNYADMSFDELSKGHDGSPPVFYHGILATGAASKGEVLGAFLDRINWKPNHIIFFDDNLKYLESVAQELRKRSIPFSGFQYLGGEQLPGALDKNVALVQLNHLIDAEEWISEDAARTRLTAQPL